MKRTATQDVVSDVDDDIALDDEDYHSALLGYHPKMLVLRVAFASCPDKPKGKGRGDYPNKIRRVKGPKGAGRSSDTRNRGKKGRGEGRPGAGHDVPSSSQVCFKSMNG